MSDSPEMENVRRRMTRCAEGHVFDARSHRACPTCGASPAGTGDQPAPIKRDDPWSPPSWLRPALIAGAAIVAMLTILVFMRGAPKSSPQSPPEAVAAKETAPNSTAPAPAPAAERWRTRMVVGGRSYDCVNETTLDGRYRLGEGCPPPVAGETGVTTVNADGSWSSRSDAGRIDSGTIEVLDADRFIAHTRAGPILWERSKD